MPQIGIKDLKAKTSQVIEEVSGGASYVVTKRGQLAAVILPIDDAEDLVLANAKEYVSMRRSARADYKKGTARKLEDLD